LYYILVRILLPSCLMQFSNKLKKYLQFTFKADSFRSSFLLRSVEQSYWNVLTFYTLRVRGITAKITMHAWRVTTRGVREVSKAILAKKLSKLGKCRTWGNSLGKQTDSTWFYFSRIGNPAMGAAKCLSKAIQKNFRKNVCRPWIFCLTRQPVCEILACA